MPTKETATEAHLEHIKDRLNDIKNDTGNIFEVLRNQQSQISDNKVEIKGVKARVSVMEKNKTPTRAWLSLIEKVIIVIGGAGATLAGYRLFM